MPTPPLQPQTQENWHNNEGNKPVLLEVVIQMYISWTSLKRSSERQQMNKLNGNKGWMILWTCTSWPLSWSASLGMRVHAWWLEGQAKDHHLPLFIVHPLFSTHREGWADLQEQQSLLYKNNPKPWQSPAFFTRGNDQWRCLWSYFGRYAQG